MILREASSPDASAAAGGSFLDLPKPDCGFRSTSSSAIVQAGPEFIGEFRTRSLAHLDRTGMN